MRPHRDIIGLIIFLLASLLFYLFFLKPFEPGLCRINRIRSSVEFSGVVLKKEENIWNHSSERLTITRDQYFEWEENSYENRGRSVYDKISVGDSVVKKKKSLELRVYKADTVLVIDLSFECNDKK